MALSRNAVVKLGHAMARIRPEPTLESTGEMEMWWKAVQAIAANALSPNQYADFAGASGYRRAMRGRDQPLDGEEHEKLSRRMQRAILAGETGSVEAER